MNQTQFFFRGENHNHWRGISLYSKLGKTLAWCFGDGQNVIVIYLHGDIDRIFGATVIFEPHRKQPFRNFSLGIANRQSYKSIWLNLHRHFSERIHKAHINKARPLAIPVAYVVANFHISQVALKNSFELINSFSTAYKEFVSPNIMNHGFVCNSFCVIYKPGLKRKLILLHQEGNRSFAREPQVAHREVC